MLSLCLDTLLPEWASCPFNSWIYSFQFSPSLTKKGVLSLIKLKILQTSQASKITRNIGYKLQPEPDKSENWVQASSDQARNNPLVKLRTGTGIAWWTTFCLFVATGVTHSRLVICTNQTDSWHWQRFSSHSVQSWKLQSSTELMYWC